MTIKTGLEYIGYIDPWTDEERLSDEEIVRCGDCEHYDPRDAGCMYWVMAANKLLHVNNPDGFCAWGERKEGR